MHATAQTTPAATALPLTQDEQYWASFAEVAGWRRIDGVWLRRAGALELPDEAANEEAYFKAPTAFAACQLDGLGPQGAREPGDHAAQLTVEGLADAMRANRHNCTEDVLSALGFPVAFQQQHKDAAVARASKDSVTHLAGHPAVEHEEMVVAGMRETIGGIMPTLANCIAILRHQQDAQGQRRYSDKQINRYMRRVVHLAAKDFVSILPAAN